VDRLSAEDSDSAYAPSTSDSAAAVQAALYGQRRAQHRAQLESYDQKISGLQAEITRAENDVSAFTARLKIAVNLETMRRELERMQVGSQLNRLIAEDQRIEMHRNVTTAMGTLETARRELQQVVAEREGFQQQWKAQISEELHERNRVLNDAKENLRKAQLRHRLVEFRADQDATVLTIAKVSLGSVMQSGDQLITLVPLDSALEVEARIAGSDAGYVKEGERVTIKFDSFPYIRYGTAAGTVRFVSADSFVTSEDSLRTASSYQPQTLAYYRARIAIDSLDVHGVPGGFQLTPGMPVIADVNVGQRNVLAYFFARVLPNAVEGMREP
jgi:HlyD family type I secretion membrane fusion protein